MEDTKAESTAAAAPGTAASGAPAAPAADSSGSAPPLYGYGVPMGGMPPGGAAFPVVMGFPASITAQAAAAAAVASGVPGTAVAAPPPAATGGRRGKNAEGGAHRMKKSPEAPKRFKSAFIIFSAEKHREIKEQLLKEGRSEKTTDIAKKVSEAWRHLKPEERKVWDDMAAKDKARFDVEKQMYQGPWKVAANRRTPKDPSAPKRPSSAFLAFSNKRRAELKKTNPNATNADLSKMLSKTWKTCDDETRREYTEAEAKLRAKYKEDIAEWRKKQAEAKLAVRTEREAFAMQQVEMKAAMGLDITGKNPDSSAMHPGMLQFLMQTNAAMQSSAAAAGGATGDGAAASGMHFNPAAMLQFAQGSFPVPPATVLSQLLANSQQQQGNALGLYGQGLPDQRPAGEQPPSAQLAGFGSNKAEGQEGGSDAQPPSLDQQMQGFQDPTMAAAMMAGPPPAQQLPEYEATAEQV